MGAFPNNFMKLKSQWYRNLRIPKRKIRSHFTHGQKCKNEWMDNVYIYIIQLNSAKYKKQGMIVIYHASLTYNRKLIKGLLFILEYYILKEEIIKYRKSIW